MPLAAILEDFLATLPRRLNDFARWRLLEGLDDVALTLRHEDAITAFEAGRPAWLPSVAPNAPASA